MCKPGFTHKIAHFSCLKLLTVIAWSPRLCREKCSSASTPWPHWRSFSVLHTWLLSTLIAARTAPPATTTSVLPAMRAMDGTTRFPQTRTAFVCVSFFLLLFACFLFNSLSLSCSLRSHCVVFCVLVVACLCCDAVIVVALF